MQTITKAPAAAPKEPNVRAYMTWSVARLRMAERMADGGDLRYAAEFCEALFGDDRAGAVLQTRIMSLLGLVPSFEPGAGDGRRSRSALRAIEAEEDWWKISPLAALMLILKWGLVLGVGPASKAWIISKGRDLPVLKLWHPSHIRQEDDGLWYTETKADGTVQIADADGHGINGLWALFMPYGSHRPWSHGMWRGAARWWLLKQYAIDDWGRHSENASLRVAERALVEGFDGSTKDARKELAADMFDASKDASIVMPDGFNMKLLELTANTREIYEAQINAANTAFAIQVLGHNLTSEVSGPGSYAAGKVGDAVRQDLKLFDNEATGTFAHDEALVDWASVNFGDGDVAPWPTWPVNEREKRAAKKAEADTMKQASATLKELVDAGAPVDQRKFLEHFEIPLLSEKDAKAQQAMRAAQQPPPPAPETQA
jgi:hypothetical protein